MSCLVSFFLFYKKEKVLHLDNHNWWNGNLRRFSCARDSYWSLCFCFYNFSVHLPVVGIVSRHCGHCGFQVSAPPTLVIIYRIKSKQFLWHRIQGWSHHNSCLSLCNELKISTCLASHTLLLLVSVFLHMLFHLFSSSFSFCLWTYIHFSKPCLGGTSCFLSFLDRMTHSFVCFTSVILILLVSHGHLFICLNVSLPH